MSVYSGFSTRKREFEYNFCLDQILKFFVVRLINSVKGDSVDELKFKKTFKNLFNSLVKLEDHKYMEPKFSETLTPLALSLKIKISHFPEKLEKDQKDPHQSGVLLRSPEEKSIDSEREFRTSLNLRPHSVGVRVKSQLRAKKCINLPNNFVVEEQTTSTMIGSTTQSEYQQLLFKQNSNRQKSTIATTGTTPISNSKAKQKAQQLMKINAYSDEENKDTKSNVLLASMNKCRESEKKINISNKCSSSKSRYHDTLNDFNLKSNSPPHVKFCFKEENKETQSKALNEMSKKFELKQSTNQQNSSLECPLGQSLQLNVTNPRNSKIPKRGFDQQQSRQFTFESIQTNFSPIQKREDSTDTIIDDQFQSSNSFWKIQQNPSPIMYSAYYMETSSIRHFHKTTDKLNHSSKKNFSLDLGLEKEPIKPNQTQCFQKQ